MSDDTNKIPQVGDLAPDFTLMTHNEGQLNLAWYRGRQNVVLAFYPGDWTPVCSTQVPGFMPLKDFFDQHDCQLLAISVDSPACHQAWAKSLGGLTFPLVSDYFPHGAVAEQYGVLSSKGYAERAVFLIDKEGVIRYKEQVHPSKTPDNDKLQAAIRLISGK
jgi:peroxiredoxin